MGYLALRTIGVYNSVKRILNRLQSPRRPLPQPLSQGGEGSRNRISKSLSQIGLLRNVD